MMPAVRIFRDRKCTAREVDTENVSQNNFCDFSQKSQYLLKQYEIRGQDDAENPETGTGVGLGEQLPKDQSGTLSKPSDNSNSPYIIE